MNTRIADIKVWHVLAVLVLAAFIAFLIIMAIHTTNTLHTEALGVQQARDGIGSLTITTP
jgi:hypothetical protein